MQNGPCPVKLTTATEQDFYLVIFRILKESIIHFHDSVFKTIIIFLTHFVYITISRFAPSSTYCPIFMPSR